MSDAALLALAHAIARRAPTVLEQLRSSPALARAAFVTGATRLDSKRWFLDELHHGLYAGDTLLHVAAVAHDLTLGRALLEARADVRARNRRGAEPLHYACDDDPNSPETWNPPAQGAMVALLIEAGADPNALDDEGVAPLHRAVRTRSVGAVEALLTHGAVVDLPNASGSTPMDLAKWTTGRGGSGTAASKAAQVEIVEHLTAARARRKKR